MPDAHRSSRPTRDLEVVGRHSVKVDHSHRAAAAANSLVRVERPPYRARHALPDAVPADVTTASHALRRRRPASAELPDRDLALNRIVADGDVEVARRLQRLDRAWRVLHAVPIEDHDSDIDHVVIGPAGIFTIRIKNHPNAKVWVRGDTYKINGFNQPSIGESRHEAQHAAKLLSDQALFDVDVRAIIAVVGAQRGVTVSEQPHDAMVTVIAGRTVADHLAASPELLGARSIERIYEVARHLATWQPRIVMWQEF